MKPKRSKREVDRSPPSDLEDAIRKVFAQYGKEGGRTRARSLTQEERSALAKRAADARWRAARAARETEWKRFKDAKSSKPRKSRGK
jgi:hypothetical protein